MDENVLKDKGPVCNICAVSDCDNQSSAVKFCSKFKEKKNQKPKFKVSFTYTKDCYTEVENVDTIDQAKLAVDSILQKHGLDWDFTEVKLDYQIYNVEELD